MTQPNMEELVPQFAEEFTKLHMLIHEVGMSGAMPEDPIKMLVLLDSIRMTNKKLEELKQK